MLFDLLSIDIYSLSHWPKLAVISHMKVAVPQGFAQLIRVDWNHSIYIMWVVAVGCLTRLGEPFLEWERVLGSLVSGVGVAGKP